MVGYRVAFDSPLWLCLLALLPLFWWFAVRGLSSLTGLWRMVSCLLRSVVFTLIVLALAETRLVQATDKLTVVYVVDQSLSIPRARIDEAIAYVNRAVERQQKEKDLAGVIYFGRDAVVERPPWDEFLKLGTTIESQLDPEYTNLAAGLKLAQASFPHDTAKRIVVISDGNQNIGDALEQARVVAEAGIGIDVLPITYGRRAEVMIEKVTIPPDVRKGEPFDLRVVVNNTSQPAEGESGVVGGRLRVSLRTGDQPVELSNDHVDLPPGKSVFTVTQKISRPEIYTYEAIFVPDNPALDTMPQNNRATTFTHVRGSGQVLLIEDFDHRGQYQALVDRLREENLEVTVQPSNQLFQSLAELQQFDTVVLANVPRSGGDNADQIFSFSDDQIRMLVRNTETMGAGLVMLGGPNSFGAGGWTNTELEKAMPVDFQIKSAEVVPKGALALVMHASEMAEGNFWQKKIAQEAIKALGTEDYCGLLHWSGTDQWLWGGMRQVGDGRNRMLAAIDRMTPGDMPQFDPCLRMAEVAFRRLQGVAAAKHMIVISDGDPGDPTPGAVNALKALGVTVSTVAVGCHGPAESKKLEALALATGGKYYQVNNPKALPKIYQREARRVAQPLVYENDAGFVPVVRTNDEIISGITNPLPPITGFVCTTVKRNPLVEVSIISPEPRDQANATILASWTYGLGRAVAYTTDAGARWAKAWPGWSNYDKFFTQMVRWSMRPVSDQGNFVVATDVEGGQVRVFVTALDKNDEFLNFLDLSGTVVGPEMEPRSVKLSQTAPGRYVGTFDAKDAGSYFLMLSPGAGKTPIRTGVNVPYSAEFSDREADPALLTSMAELVPKGGASGVVIRDPSGKDDLDALLETDCFRHDLPRASSGQDVWPALLVVAGCLFFFDVFFRRVTLSFAWAPPLAAAVRDFVLRRDAQAPRTETMDRLRSRKAEVSEQLEQRRAAARFEPAPDATSSGPAPDLAHLEAEMKTATQRPAAPPRSTAEKAPEESYTERLLKAKKKVWEERDKKDE
jgi:uncharacterized membrane protein/Mg-chelatase subunit ChlD